jgi:hypothetical protein
LGKPTDSTLNEYEMVKKHSDFVLHDDAIASMSEHPSWKQDYQNQFLEAMGNDRVINAWWGDHYAANSSLEDYPLLQDTGVGFLKLAEDRIPTRFLQVDEIKIGTIAENGNDYKTLDQLINTIYQMIPLHRRTLGMTALVSESLMGYAEGIYYAEQGGTPSEKPLIKKQQVTGAYGGLDIIPAPYLPQSVILITGLKRNGQTRSNLSIYWQADSWNRSTEYFAKKESSVDWNARREACHIEDLQAFSGVKAQKIIFTDFGKHPKGHALAGQWIAQIELLPVDNFAEM